MTQPTPIPQNPKPAARLSVLNGRRGCMPHDVRVLLDLNRQLERVTRAHVAIAGAIVRKLEGAA